MLNLERVRAVTLDLDDTLWPVWPVIERAELVLQAWLERHAPATARYWGVVDNRRELRRQVGIDWAHRIHDLGALRQETLRRAMALAGEDQDLAGAAYQMFHAERQRVNLFDDVLPSLEFLAQRLPVVALSNGNADVHRIGIGRHFHASVSAGEVGIGKPDPRIFQIAAERAGVSPQDVLHVGDDAELDVRGALAVGMQTVWVNREGKDWVHGDHRPHLSVIDLHALCRLWQ